MNNFFTELKLKKKCKLKKRKVYIKILFLFSHCYLIPPTPHLLVQAVTQCSFYMTFLQHHSGKKQWPHIH